MITTVKTSDAPSINWGAVGMEEVVQNVFTIMSTFKYEIAYARMFGLDGGFVDRPEDEAGALAIAEIYTAINQWEPRADVLDVSVLGREENGGLLLQVVIDV
ncbi:hypothetical protein [Gorillibacterium sp. CAU 1737]|uniref:hypothetical protein n=1 Tax=Gorillibacterium sp. CAU 1737 TaxID=3140362 RepID=UPI0032618BF3